jgi:hypothetical protein
MKNLLILVFIAFPFSFLPDNGSEAGSFCYAPAGQFLVEQFKEKDIIFLGEVHRTREQVLFVSSIIPVLHQNGINIVFSEFANFEDTGLIDSLINSEKYDETLARQIQHNNSWDWDYREYVDLYYSAWKTNHSLKEGEEPFRIIGLEKKNYGIYDAEQVWAKIINDTAMKKNKKALVYCGMNHAFTTYKQPYVVDDQLSGFINNRVGNLIFQKYPERTITILMHGPWPEKDNIIFSDVLPCEGRIDSLYFTLPKNAKEIGFSTGNNLAGDFKSCDSYYSIGYPDFTLKGLCQGYVVIKPICELHPVTPIPDFINEGNISKTREQSGWSLLSIDDFNDSLKIWYQTDTRHFTEINNKYCR